MDVSGRFNACDVNDRGMVNALEHDWFSSTMVGESTKATTSNGDCSFTGVIV